MKKFTPALLFVMGVLVSVTYNVLSSERKPAENISVEIHGIVLEIDARERALLLPDADDDSLHTIRLDSVDRTVFINKSYWGERFGEDSVVVMTGEIVSCGDGLIPAYARWDSGSFNKVYSWHNARDACEDKLKLRPHSRHWDDIADFTEYKKKLGL